MATDLKTGQPIFGRYGVGLHNVGSYQAAGHPFITGSALANGVEHKISFPMVTKAVTVIADGTMSGDLRVHFQSTASGVGHAVAGHHYITLDDNEDSLTFNVKCKEIYLTANGTGVNYELFAELTNIPTDRMFALTGSGITDAGTNPRSDR